jgi:uncharacterized glyoxalase superfamily protein PhnB/catechol 2,3-dioxygenase-like lactoylglutathione lyase family enzyme
MVLLTSAPSARFSQGALMPQSITPYLCVADAASALDWYRTHFGATIGNVIDWDGRIGHAEVEFAGNVFFLSDEAPQLGVVAPLPGAGVSTSFVVRVADVDIFIDRAVAGGAVLERPIEHAHGSRNGWIKDPHGHRWNIGTPDRLDAAALRRPSDPYYLTITSTDVEQAVAFYGQVLDWQFAEPHNGARHITNTSMPMGLRPQHAPVDNTEPGEIQLWFTVRDFDNAVDRVRTAGGTVLTVTGYDSGREARCQDDQGTLFRLSEPAPGYDTH